MASRRAALLGLGASVLWAGPGRAEDYRPAVCSTRKPYAGAAPRAPVEIDPVGEATEAPFDPEIQARLDAAFAKARAATAAPSMSAAVRVPGRGAWARTEAAGDAPLLFWASAGKTAIAVVVLQLVEAGRLSLDDPLAKWVKGAPNGDLATVRDLLAHTSGLFSANEDLKVRAERRGLSVEEQVRVAARHGAMFCPGERWRYTNTGYALLGEIIARVDGRSYADAVAARIIEPLGLTRMRVVRPGERGADVAPLASAKGEAMDPAWAGAAGPIAASAQDMARFWAALLGGRLLRVQTVRSMFETLYPMFDPGTFYGLGVMVFEVPQPGGGSALWLGHAGGAPGAGAVVLYSPADRAFVAVALTGDGSATATANLLLRQISRA